MRKENHTKIIKISDEELKELQNKLDQNNLGSKEIELLASLLKIYLWLSQLYFSKKLSLKKLKQLFFPATEKKTADSKNENKEEKDKKEKEKKDGVDKPSTKKKGHGRNGVNKFTGAEKSFHKLKDFKEYDKCPYCGCGKLYSINPGTFIQFTGSCPINCTIHELQKIKCNTCAEIFEAKLPDEIEKKKFDETADVSIAIQHYGLGIPFYRLEKWQKDFGIPLPSSTQWERVEFLGTSAYPVFESLKNFASNGTLYYIDDTGNKILDLKKHLKDTNEKRKGIYTTGIISRVENKDIKLFFTGNKHAGENISSLLKIRCSDDPIILMSDALSRNCPKDFIGIWCNCLTHARRGFYYYKDEYPQKVAHILHLFGKIYYFDKISKEKKHSPEERLLFHQKKSERIIKKIRSWCLKMLYLKKVEPNEELGGAIKYFLSHYKKLTEFLRIPGCPLDNNYVENLLKTVVLHRKNCLFYKSSFGAYIGDLFMSLIQTAKACGVNSYKYLLSIHKNKAFVKANPQNWFPWNYHLNTG